MTTTIATEQEQWAAAINAACDPLTLLAYADWLEERGDETARVWRWFAEHEREPVLGRFVSALWDWCKANPWKDHRYRLPLNTNGNQGYANWYAQHATRFAAYEAAARALAETYPEEIPRP